MFPMTVEGDTKGAAPRVPSLDTLSETIYTKDDMLSAKSSPTTSKPSADRDADVDICDRLNRAQAWRLDKQCATLQPRQQRMIELSEILHKAGRLSSNNRLRNQDYTPPEIRRVESLQRVASGLGHMADKREDQRSFMSSIRARELFLVGIAGKLGRVDGRTCLGAKDDDDEDGGAERSAEKSTDCQRALLPKDLMRRFLLRSIDRLNSLTKPLDDQRFVKT